MAEPGRVLMRVVLNLTVEVDADITYEAMEEIGDGLREQAELTGDVRDAALDDFYLLGSSEVSS